MNVTGTNDHHYMQRALHLAEGGRGRTSPNPMTGCVVVKGGCVIGEGFHARHGTRHAEAAALAACRETNQDPRGAHLYCNLEPCAAAYPGKLTPPCAAAIIRAGIGQVTVATLDPNPHVSGAGVRLLREAGIQVTVGVAAEAALLLNVPFFTAVHYQRPYVHLKIAQSLDGRIAARGGDSRWITDAAARRMVHRMRSEHDAVVVGRGTALHDDPQLTVRDVEADAQPAATPWRVVLDSRLALPADARLVSDEHAARTIVLTTEQADPARRRELTGRGVQVQVVAAGAGGRTDIDAVLQALYERGIRSLLVEGGGTVYTSFLRAGRFDRLSVFVAPLLIGDGVAAVGDLGIDRIAEATRLQGATTRIVNEQVLVSGYRDLGTLRQAVLPEGEAQPAVARAG
jgi:diaminohydroxyphosphoribosylaminopyrimidine deaminase/5-amino-6-(5-phosphoribosylamino)uracil reductase